MNTVPFDFENLKIPEVILIKPRVFNDNRGFFRETFKKSDFREAGIRFDFVQENHSRSSYGVLRGLHYQLPPYNQAKLVRVSKGVVLDVIVDIRTDSPTYAEHMTFLLTDYDNVQLFIPRGFAHGFVAISKNVRFQYKVDNPYAPDFDRGLIYNDYDLNIDWEVQNPIIGDKDKQLPRIKDTLHFKKEGCEKNPEIL